MRATDAAGNLSGNSNTASATTPSGPPPSVTYVRDSDMANRTGTNSDAHTSFQVSGSNPAIIVTAALNSSTGNVSSIALSNGLTGGTPYRCKQQRSGTTDLEIWAIPAPSGTGTITINYSVTADHQSNAALFNNVNQTNPCSTVDSVSISGSTSPLSVTPTNVTSSDMVVYGGAQTAAGDAPHATSGTEIFFGNNTSQPRRRLSPRLRRSERHLGRDCIF